MLKPSITTPLQMGAMLLSGMRLSSRIRWIGALLIFVLGGCWSFGTLFPDQVFSAYQKASDWIRAVGPIQHLPAPAPMLSVDASPEGSRKPYVVLSVNAAAQMIKGRGWQPTEAEIGGLEASLPLVPQLRAENWLPRYDLRIEHPEQYFRQYFPVVQKGKKLIYVNAFRDEIPNWRQRIVIIMDGGTCCWQAFYDPAMHAFLALRINGVA